EPAPAGLAEGVADLLGDGGRGTAAQRAGLPEPADDSAGEAPLGLAERWRGEAIVPVEGVHGQRGEPIEGDLPAVGVEHHEGRRARERSAGAPRAHARARPRWGRARARAPSPGAPSPRAPCTAWRRSATPCRRPCSPSPPRSTRRST